MFQLAKDLLAQGVPIHGVGLQMHLHLTEFNRASTLANIARFKALGLEVNVSELDVRIPLPATPESLDQQAAVYRAVLDAVLEAGASRHFIFWGFTDRKSWIPKWFPGTGAALPFDEEFRPKPAYQALRDRLAQPPAR